MQQTCSGILSDECITFGVFYSVPDTWHFTLMLRVPLSCHTQCTCVCSMTNVCLVA